MQHKLVKTDTGACLYKLDSKDCRNNYYIISNESTRRLMASPEVVGFDSYLAMVPPTSEAIKAMQAIYREQGKALQELSILTILRGGLNYPVEECCHSCGIQVNNINFLSCERTITNGEITGIDVKYEKIRSERSCTLMIGDIIASGDTLKLCMRHLTEYFRAVGGSIKRIIFFTIGGTKAINLLESMNNEICRIWEDFEGFDCIFYEGMFTVYETKGVTGVNIPNIDFGWQGASISPEFRRYILEYEYAPALLEKCIIYDGGARRYEIDSHFREVLEYWEDLLEASQKTDFEAFIAEKVGYFSADYPQWLALNNYPENASLQELYEIEQNYLDKLRSSDLREICAARIEQLKHCSAKYHSIK